MSESTILLQKEGNVAWLYLNRPKAMNAINSEMIAELTAALVDVAKDDEIRVLVLSGKGRAFCAGGDLGSLLKGLEPATDGTPDFLHASGEMYKILRGLAKPVIGCINGLAIAGGLEMVLSCDFVFAADNVKIGDGHSNFGVFPGAGGAAILPSRIGLNRAKYLLFSGENLPAADFVDCGLIQKILPADELVSFVADVAEKLAQKSPAVLSRMKEVANASIDKTAAEALNHEMVVLRNHLRSYDMSEGLAAFNEKRTPKFRGY